MRNENVSRILVVDDEPCARLQLSEIISIEFEHLQVRQAGDGKDALEIIREWMPHVVLTDIHMPGLNGLDLLDHARKLAPAIQFIIFTGRDDKNTPIQALRQGASDYLRKPLEIDELVMAVRRALERCHIQEQITRYQQHLERMVEERTSRLQEINACLQREIEERMKVEQELIQSQCRLRSLGARLESVREEERTSIAREIHDQLGQVLTFMRMDLAWLRKKLPENEKTMREKIFALQETTDQAITTVQRISRELRPVMLDDLGLCAAIEWQAMEFQKHFDIICEVLFIPEDLQVDSATGTALFRIFQEALTNVARHSRATKAKVSIREKPGALEFKVSDNGIGFELDRHNESSSLGLLGIKERVLFLGGTFNIRGTPGKGTLVTATIPVQNGRRKR